MYKFFGEPLKEIKSKTSGKTMFRFDTKGEFITDDPEIIRRAKGYFDCLELKAEPVGEKIERTVIIEPTKITTKHDEEIKEEPQDETEESPKIYKCKKCDFETDNKGLLAAHYKKEHPKEV